MAYNNGEARTALLAAAVTLFRDRGYDNVSVAEIARAAGAYPNQVTYHFGGKEPLFIHAASHAVLHTARLAEQRTRGSATPEAHARGLVTYLLGPGAKTLTMYAEAMLAARRVPALQQIIVTTHAALYDAGERAMADTFTRTGWTVRALPGEITRGFWAAVLGLALEKATLGASFNKADADAVTLMLVRLNTGDLTPTDTPTDTPTGQEHP